MTYREWIAQYVASKNGHVLGFCKAASAEMAKAFPELTIVRGHVHDAAWGRRGHVWLTEPDGTIVDPTEAQFSCILEYEPWKPGDEVRVGRCMNCGEEIWKAVQTLDADPGHTTFCSVECGEEMTADFNAGIA